MKAFLFVLFTVLLIFALVGSIYILIVNFRNSKVCDYKIELNDRCCKVCNDYLTSIPGRCFGEEQEQYYLHLRKLWEGINDISYDKMLYQFWKPLKDEYWLTQEQIDFLNLEFKNNESIHRFRTKQEAC